MTPRATSGDQLLCGARVDELLDQVSAGHDRDYDVHQAVCTHCQAALAEYARLWAPVREVADTEVRAPDSFLENALARIRGTVAEPDYGVVTGTHGTTRIAARVVVITARETAQDIAGVRVALSKLETAGVTPTRNDLHAEPAAPPAVPVGGGDGHDAIRDEGPRVVAGVAGRSTAIEVTLAADYGVNLVELGARIRAEVATRVRQLTGLEPVAVTVRIDDVFD